MPVIVRISKGGTVFADRNIISEEKYKALLKAGYDLEILEGNAPGEKPGKMKLVGLSYNAFLPIFKKIFPNIKVIENYREVCRYDLIIFPGGEDVNPQRYHERNLYACYNDFRDDREISIASEAFNRDKKILGICRGHQLLNTISGGSLWQDISLQKEAGGYHPDSHPIDFVRESTVLSNFFKGVPISSTHHQGVRQAGNIGKVSSMYKNVVESVESLKVISMQPHPEFDWTPAEENPANKFFKFLGTQW